MGIGIAGSIFMALLVVLQSVETKITSNDVGNNSIYEFLEFAIEFKTTRSKFDSTLKSPIEQLFKNTVIINHRA